MRVITGSARGRRLLTLEGEDVRPTTDRVKEAVFSIIQFEVEGRAFLDLFAGSGQMGIEALSRGAASATFVDNSKKSVETVKKNLKTTCFENSARVVQTDWRSFLSMTGERYDIAFLDPPYGTGILQDALVRVADAVKDTGVIIAESPMGEELPDACGDFVPHRQYRYGKIKITIFRHKDYCNE